MDPRVPDLIQWHEGLLLTPQHFQQMSQRTEALVQGLPQLFVPFGWGIRSFEFDAGDFTSGVLTVRALDAVLPDGLHVVFAPERDYVQLDLRPLAATLRQKPLLVHLAMPHGEGQTTSAQHRFASYEGDPIADENTGEGGVTIARLRPRLSLIAAEQPPARYRSFPLIEVRCEGETFLQTPFAPPTLQVRGSSPLGKKCAAVSERLREKALGLSERAILSPQSPFAAEARDHMLMLVSALPALEALLRSETAHAFALYLELCRVAGAVAVLGRSMMPPVFPAYQHNDPLKSYEQVSQFVLQSVDEGVADKVRRFSFMQDEEQFRLPADLVWSRAFDPAAGARTRVALAVRTDASDDQAIAWGENCVIGGRAAIPSLIARRILGLGRRFADHIGEMTPPRGLHLFELMPDPDVVQQGEDLLVLGSTSGVRPDALYLYLFDQDAESRGQ